MAPPSDPSPLPLRLALALPLTRLALYIFVTGAARLLSARRHPQASSAARARRARGARRAPAAPAPPLPCPRAVALVTLGGRALTPAAPPRPWQARLAALEQQGGYASLDRQKVYS